VHAVAGLGQQGRIANRFRAHQAEMAAMRAA